MLTISGMTDSEKNDFINFIYGQLKEREAQNEALHAKLDAQMDRFDKLQATLDAISSQLAESNKMKEVLQKGFDNSWKQVMAWRNDGRYPIDRSALPLGLSKNSEAERNIRTMTIERSNSKSFGSNEGVESSAVYHTIIATCKAQAISVCEYLKKFFTACVNGRTDYERSSLSRLPLDLVAWLVQEPTGRKNLTPMMLCQPVK